MSYNCYLLDKDGNPIFGATTKDPRGGEIYISVSQILSTEAAGDFLTYWLLRTFAGSEDPVKEYRAYMSRVSNLGTKLHHFIECELKGIAYPDEVTDDMMPGIESFFRWKREYTVEVLDSERTLHSKKYRVAGTLDLRARIDGKPYLIDLKTGTVVHKAFVQLMAYNTMAAEMGILDNEPHDLMVLGGESSKSKIADGGDFCMHTVDSFFNGRTTKEDLFVWFQCLRQIWFMKNTKSIQFKPVIKHMEKLVDPLVEDFKKQFVLSGVQEIPKKPKKKRTKTKERKRA